MRPLAAGVRRSKAEQASYHGDANSAVGGHAGGFLNVEKIVRGPMERGQAAIAGWQFARTVRRPCWLGRVASSENCPTSLSDGERRADEFRLPAEVSCSGGSTQC